MISEIQISDDERCRGFLPAERLSMAINILNAEGYLVVRNVLPADHLKRLKVVLDGEWNAFTSSRPNWCGGGRIIGHLSLNPSKTPDFIHPDAM